MIKITLKIIHKNNQSNMIIKKTQIVCLLTVTLLLLGCSNIQNIQEEPNEKNIIIKSPLPEETISSPLKIEGEAVGSWYFEGSFTVTLVDWDGLIIAENQVTAESDWMTEDYVKFNSELTFETPTLYKTGAIIFKKANPSGLPENDEYYEMQIKFE
jgi:hypothetical protein